MYHRDMKSDTSRFTPQSVMDCSNTGSSADRIRHPEAALEYFTQGLRASP